MTMGAVQQLVVDGLTDLAAAIARCLGRVLDFIQSGGRSATAGALLRRLLSFGSLLMAWYSNHTAIPKGLACPMMGWLPSALASASLESFGFDGKWLGATAVAVAVTASQYGTELHWWLAEQRASGTAGSSGCRR